MSVHGSTALSMFTRFHFGHTADVIPQGFGAGVIDEPKQAEETYDFLEGQEWPVAPRYPYRPSQQESGWECGYSLGREGIDASPEHFRSTIYREAFYEGWEVGFNTLLVVSKGGVTV